MNYITQKDLETISEEILLNEAFSNPYEWEEDSSNNKTIIVKFRTDSGIQMRVVMSSVNEEMRDDSRAGLRGDSPWLTRILKLLMQLDFERYDVLDGEVITWMVSFDAEGYGYSPTNRNEAMRTFSTVMAIMKEYADQLGIQSFMFSGASSDLTRTYLSIAEYMRKREGYQYTTTPNKDMIAIRVPDR